MTKAKADDVEITEKSKIEDDPVIETPSGKKVDTSKLVMGVGYTYKNGDPLSDEDREFVAAEMKKRG